MLAAETVNVAFIGLIALLRVSAIDVQRPTTESCSDEVAQKAMAHALYLDDEGGLRQFICGDEACTEATFREGLEFRQETLRTSPRAIGCFVDAGRQSTDTLVALFLWSGSAPKLEMVFFGRDLSPDRQDQGRGFKALIGAHRTEVDDQPEERFVWNGRGYQATEKRPCADPRVVLSVRRNRDRSGRIAVQQALVANPEFKVVPEKAHAPLELDFYQTIYGTKNFARKYPGDPMFSEAVVARCADASTCNRAAAAFHAAFPSEHIELVCGVPPKTTGGFSRVPELAAERLVIPGRGAPLQAFCARAQACLAHESSAVRPKPDCSGIKREKLLGCTELPSCGSVAACLGPDLP